MKKKLWVFLTCCLFILCLGCDQEVCGCLPEKEQPKSKQEAILSPQNGSHELII
jgi:hypothetical protein